MFNFLDKIREEPGYYKQLSVDEQLVTKYDCPLDQPKVGLWSNQSYFAYVIDGKKTWHAQELSVELTKGTCIFVKKGAHVVEQFFDTRFCVLIFFVSDTFIVNTVRSVQQNTWLENEVTLQPITRVAVDETTDAFFESVIPYFFKTTPVSKTLLELKFRELLLNVISNSLNSELSRYFNSLTQHEEATEIRKIMEENFCYNLPIEAYARLCGKSLSSFKRFFQEHFHTSPGKWLLDRRLEHAKSLLLHTGNTISEVAYESGFENPSHFSRVYKHKYGSSPVTQRSKSKNF